MTSDSNFDTENFGDGTVFVGLGRGVGSESASGAGLPSHLNLGVPVS